MINYIKNNFLKMAFIGYFLFLLLSCFFISPFRDTFYYWDWSRHLGLSYFDGPPLIAYTIRLFTLFFGNTLFALNFLGLASVLLISFIIYKITKLLADSRTGLLAAVLYFTAPFVNQELLSKVTYDNLLSLFWLLSLYFAIRYIRYQKTSDIYRFALAAGLMLLSKYDGIVLLLALLIYFLSSKEQRRIFSNPHFYAALALIAFMFSPVLIWNAQNGWISFQYQMAVHHIGVIGYANGKPIYQSNPVRPLQPVLNVIEYLWAILLNFNVIALAAFGVLLKGPRSLESNFLKWLCLCFIIFWAAFSAFSNIAANYSLPLFAMVLIMAVFYFKQQQKISLFLVGVFLSIDVFATLSHIEGLPFNSRQDHYILAKEANLIYAKKTQPVIVPHYVAAEQIAYWLKAKPQVYALSCGLDADQYRFWQEDFMAKLAQHQIKQALFLDYMDEPDCIAPYFKQCTKLSILSYKSSQLYVYQCEN